MLGVHDAGRVALGPFPVWMREDRFAARVQKQVLIPVASPAGWRVRRPVRELREGPAVSKRLLEAVDPAGPIDRLGLGPAIP